MERDRTREVVEKLTKKDRKIREILVELTKLEPLEFIGICEILGVKVLDGEEERKFEVIWGEVVDKIIHLNRTRRRNFERLVRAATKKRHGSEE